MSERVSQIVLLCEDRLQASLVRAYMRRCGLQTKEPLLMPLVASERASGGNVNWVLREFPRQFRACRQRHTHARTLLIVVVDADEGSVDQRHSDLNSALEGARMTPTNPSDPIVILVPKRHIETWIRAANGSDANETDNYKFPPPGQEQVRGAAQRIQGWARDNPAPDENLLPSLKRSLPEWRKIG